MLIEALAAVVVGGLTAGVAGPILRRLAEPADGAGKITYRALATPRLLAVTGTTAAVATAIAGLGLPGPVQPLWWVLSSLGVLLVVMDARTTWLPLRLTQLAWLGMAVAGAGAAAWSTAVGGEGWRLGARAAVGALAAGTLYWLVWRTSRGGFGFGDVRFAPLIGAATAAGSLTLLLWALIAGSFLGGLHGAVRLLAHRRAGFPYAPAMLAGAYLAVLLLAISGGSPS